MVRSRIPQRSASTVALCALVMWGASAQAAGQPSKHPPAEEHGEQLFRENCWHCHGKRALGDGPLAQSGPVDAPALAGRVPEDREDWVVVVHRGQGTMPAFAPVMDRAAVRSILTWLDALDPETGAGPNLDEKAAKKAAEKAREAEEKAKKDKEGAAKEASDEGSPAPASKAENGEPIPEETEAGQSPREPKSPPGDRL